MLATFTSHCKLCLSLCSFTALSLSSLFTDLGVSIPPFGSFCFSRSPLTRTQPGLSVSQALGWRKPGVQRLLITAGGRRWNRASRRAACSSPQLCRARRSAQEPGVKAAPRNHPSSAARLHRLHAVSKTCLSSWRWPYKRTCILTLFQCYAWSRTAQSLQPKKDEALLTYA